MSIGLRAMAQQYQFPLTQQQMAPFLEMEKDRSRQMMIRMATMPAFGAAAHLAPIVPASIHGIAGAGALPITSAVPLMAGMANPIVGGAAAAGIPIMQSLAPLLAMGSLSMGAGVLGSVGAYKLYKMLSNKIRQRRAAKAQAALGQPKLGAILMGGSKKEQDMFENASYVKFAAAGAGYDVPESLGGLVEKLGFTMGLLGAIYGDGSRRKPQDSVHFDNLHTATKTANALVTALKQRKHAKLASNGRTAPSLREIAADCYADSVINSEFSKVASVVAPDGLGVAVFNQDSKVARALDFLGIDQRTVQALVGQRQPTGVNLGILSLFA